MFDVYDKDGTRQARCYEPEAAACLVGNLYCEGSTIRVKEKIVWTEGKEKCSAAESYDTVAETIYERLG